MQATYVTQRAQEQSFCSDLRHGVHSTGRRAIPVRRASACAIVSRRDVAHGTHAAVAVHAGRWRQSVWSTMLDQPRQRRRKRLLQSLLLVHFQRFSLTRYRLRTVHSGGMGGAVSQATVFVRTSVPRRGCSVVTVATAVVWSSRDVHAPVASVRLVRTPVALCAVRGAAQHSSTAAHSNTRLVGWWLRTRA